MLDYYEEEFTAEEIDTWFTKPENYQSEATKRTHFDAFNTIEESNKIQKVENNDLELYAWEIKLTLSNLEACHLSYQSYYSFYNTINEMENKIKVFKEISEYVKHIYNHPIIKTMRKDINMTKKLDEFQYLMSICDIKRFESYPRKEDIIAPRSAHKATSDYLHGKDEDIEEIYVMQEVD